MKLSGEILTEIQGWIICQEVEPNTGWIEPVAIISETQMQTYFLPHLLLLQYFDKLVSDIISYNKIQIK